MTTKSRNNDVDRIIGQNLRMRRIMAKMSQENLGEALGVSFQQIQKYEKGSNRLSGSTMIRAATALNTTVAELMGEDRPIEPHLLQTMTTRDGAALVEAFNRIEAADDRALVVKLATKLAAIQGPAT